uniref:[histone H3]-lysine(4) N-trimethyltransferase n=1 Tax=Tetraodon nigroviridis TaxID=99883 RepID=H3C5E3_TETNG
MLQDCISFSPNIWRSLATKTFSHSFLRLRATVFTIEDEELSHLGTAVYPDVALINHSCLPSVIVTYNGTSADVRAVRDMNPGDEVLISYIDVLYPTEDRNTRLRESYYFTCQCQECGSQSSDQAKLKLRKRSDPAEAEVINTMVRYARKCIREFRVFKNSNTPASTLLEMCEQSLDEMGAVFDESNVYMLHMMYQAMGVCLYMQDPDGALRYGEKIAKYYRKLYPAYSLNLSSLYLKLGRLYFGMERNSECISVLKKAKAIMEVTHGKNHFYVTELDRQMKEV